MRVNEDWGGSPGNPYRTVLFPSTPYLRPLSLFPSFLSPSPITMVVISFTSTGPKFCTAKSVGVKKYLFHPVPFDTLWPPPPFFTGLLSSVSDHPCLPPLRFRASGLSPTYSSDTPGRDLRRTDPRSLYGRERERVVEEDTPDLRGATGSTGRPGSKPGPRV